MVDIILYTIYLMLGLSVLLVLWSLIHQYATRD